MTEVGRLKDGRLVGWDATQNTFLVAERPVTAEEVVQLNDTGQVTWSGAGMQNWARDGGLIAWAATNSGRDIQADGAEAPSVDERAAAFFARDEETPPSGDSTGSQPTPKGSQQALVRPFAPKFCVNCGANLDGGPKYCPHCGFPVEELSIEEAAVDTTKGSKPSTSPERLGYRFGAFLRRLRHRDPKSIALVAGLIVLAFIIGSAVNGYQQESARQAEVAAQQAAAQAEGQYLSHGLRLINQSQAFATLVRNLSAPSSPFGKPHVSIGRAADYNDEVLVTVVWPGQSAWQVMINPDSPPPSPRDVYPKEIGANNLDPSLTNWNGSVDDQGHILLNGFEQQSVLTN